MNDDAVEPVRVAAALQPGALRPSPWGIRDLLMALGLAVGGFLVIILTSALVAAVGKLRGHPGRELAAGLAATFLFELCLLALALSFSVRKYRLSLREYGFRSFPLAESYLPAAGVCGTFVILFIYIGVASRLHLSGLLPSPNLPKGVFEFKNLTFPAGVEACLVAPLVEEAFFRGFVFRGLLGRGLTGGIRLNGAVFHAGFWTAALVSGFLFALFHGQIGLLVPFTGVGTLFAWLFWRSGSLWPNILAHAGFNAVSFALSLASHH